jgi:hypothetical protein
MKDQQSITHKSSKPEGGIQIVVNKEDKVVNHLTKDVNPNLNLMFYDFNDFSNISKP